MGSTWGGHGLAIGLAVAQPLLGRGLAVAWPRLGHGLAMARPWLYGYVVDSGFVLQLNLGGQLEGGIEFAFFGPNLVEKPGAPNQMAATAPYTRP